MNPTNPLMEQLHDIEGLDTISAWPLAIGWWVVIGFGIVATALLLFLLVRWIAYKRSWKNDAIRRLAELENGLSESTARDTLIALSEYIRRIALRRYSRKECAGLAGDEWLKWLTKNDPKQFDWEKHGTLLVDIPYSPLNAKVASGEIKNLIQAVKNWVH